MILTLLKKDLQLYFSDKKGILITFLLPIIMITLLRSHLVELPKRRAHQSLWVFW